MEKPYNRNVRSCRVTIVRIERAHDIDRYCDGKDRDATPKYLKQGGDAVYIIKIMEEYLTVR